MSLRRFSPAFKELINDAARKCFGNLPMSKFRSGFEYLKRKPYGDAMKDHYFPNFNKDFRAVDPNFKTELEERRASKLIKLRKRGRGPPKKGQGKRPSRTKK